MPFRPLFTVALAAALLVAAPCLASPTENSSVSPDVLRDTRGWELALRAGGAPLFFGKADGEEYGAYHSGPLSDGFALGGTLDATYRTSRYWSFGIGASYRAVVDPHPESYEQRSPGVFAHTVSVPVLASLVLPIGDQFALDVTIGLGLSGTTFPATGAPSLMLGPVLRGGIGAAYALTADLDLVARADAFIAFEGGASSDSGNGFYAWYAVPLEAGIRKRF